MRRLFSKVACTIACAGFALSGPISVLSAVPALASDTEAVNEAAAVESTETMSAADQTTADGERIFAGGWPYATPPTGHFNMFIENAITLKYFRELHQLPLATYVKSTDTYDPLLATDWNVSDDNKTFTVDLRDDVTWKSGDKFTAQDVVTTFLMYRLVGDPCWDYIDSVKAASDTKVEFGIKTPSSILYRQVLRKPMVDTLTYGEYADKVAALLDAGKDETSEDWTALSDDFNNFRPTMCNATGPFYLDQANVTDSQITLVKNEKSFLKDTVQFDKVVVYNGDVPELTPLILNGQIDFLTHLFPAASLQTFEGMGYKLLQTQGTDGLALYMNESVAPLDNIAVRQAIAHVVNRDTVGSVALPGVTAGVKYITGMNDVATEIYVDVDMLDPYEPDTDKAAELLEGAGFTQKDGKWYEADGTEFTLSVQCPSGWSDGTTAATEIAQELTAFGIKSSVDGIDDNARQTNITNGDYQLALSFFGSGQPHPYYCYEVPLVQSNENATVGLAYPMEQDTKAFGKVDLAQLLTESTAGWDADAQKDAINKVAVTVNETVPYIPLYVKNTKYVTSDGLRTDWGTDDSLYQNSAGDDSFVVIKLLRGELKPIG